MPQNKITNTTKREGFMKKSTLKLLERNTIEPQPFVVVDESGNPIFMRDLALLVERFEKAVEKAQHFTKQEESK